MFRKITIIVLLLTFSTHCLAQPRVNGTNTIPLLQTSSPLITSIIGWAYDENTQRWCGYHNTISYKYNNNSVVPKTYNYIEVAKQTCMDPLLWDNLQSLQFRKYIFDGKTYYMLVEQSWNGYFDYPNIFRGFHPKKVTSVYATTEEEYTKLKEANDTINFICLYYVGSMPYLEDYAPHSFNSIQAMFRDKFHTGSTEIEDNIYNNRYKTDSNNNWIFTDSNRTRLFFKKGDDKHIRISKIGIMDADLKYNYYEILLTN